MPSILQFLAQNGGILAENEPEMGGNTPVLLTDPLTINVHNLFIPCCLLAMPGQRLFEKG
jgi:hypothetical protein